MNKKIDVGDLMRLGRSFQKIPNKGWIKPGTTNPNFFWIERIQEVKDFLDSYPKNTRRAYRTILTEFLVYSELNMQELLTLDDHEIKSTIKAACARKRETAPAQAWRFFVCLNSFFDYHDRRLHWKRNEKIRNVVVKARYTPSSDEVWRIAESSMRGSRPTNPRNKAIILFGFMTGMRRNAIQSSLCGMMKGYSEGDCPISIQVHSENFLPLLGHNKKVWAIDDKLKSNNYDYIYTFLDKEGFLAIQDYFRWRKRIYGSIEDKEPLFAKLGSYAYKQFGVSGVELWRIFKHGLRTTNIDPKTCSLHSLRRAFKKVCIKAGVDYEAREAMMGHKVPGSASSYWDTHDPEIVRKEYLKCDWSGTGIHHVARIENQLEEMRMENMVLAEKLKRLEKASDIEERLARLEAMYGEKAKSA